MEELIERHKETLGRAIGEEIIEGLKALANSAHRAAPWHGKSVYGEERGPDEHIPAVDLCTEEIARELLEKAEASLQITKRFIETWFHPAQ